MSIRITLPKAGKPLLLAAVYGASLTLLVFAISYYRLRIFSDAAGNITDIARSNGFAMGHCRFIIIVNQLLPVLFLKLHAPLRMIAIFYSFNHTLVPVTLALLCAHWLKRPYYAVAILLLALLMSVLLFYYPISELQTGLFILVFYDCITEKASADNRHRTFLIATVIIVPTITFAHPMMLLIMLWWLTYRFLKAGNNHRNTAIAGVVFIIAYLIKKFWFTSYYELAKMPEWNGLQTFDPIRYYTGPFARSFYHYLMAEAFMFPATLLCTTVLLVWLRKYRLMLLLLLGVGGIFSLVLYRFEDWGYQRYDQYYEHMLQPAVCLLALLFCYALEHARLPDAAKAGAIMLIFIVSLAKINTGKAPHVERQRWLSGYLELMDRLHTKKAYCGRIWIPERLFRSTFWSANWESLVLSSLDGPQASKTIFFVWNPGDVKEPVHAPDEFVGDGGSYKQRELPTRYFNLGSHSYLNLEQAAPDSVLEHLQWR